MEAPTYGQPKVEPAQEGGARFTDDATPSSFGGGPTLEQAGAAVDSVAQEATRIGETAWHQANQVKVLDADRQMNDLESQIIYDKDKGLLAQRGQGAAAAFGPAMDQLKAGADKIASGLSNDEQRIAFTQMANSRRFMVERVGQRYVDQELKRYDDETMTAGVNNARDMAIKAFDDPHIVEDQLGKQEAILVDYAKRNGKGQDWLNERITDSWSKTHLGVIHQYLAGGADQPAQAYFDKNKAELSGPDMIAAKHGLEEGTLRGESQRKADDILATAKDRNDALQVLRDNVDDPKLRDMTEDRINKFFGEQKQAQAEAQKDVYEKAALLVDQNPSKDVRQLVDPSSWSAMTAEQREALQRRAEDPPNNDKKWLDFIDLSPTQMQGLSRADFETQYWSSFDRVHRGRAESLWESAQDGRRQSAALSSKLTFEKRVDDTIRTSGLIPATSALKDLTNDQRTMYAQFEQAAASQVEQFETQDLGGRRKATGDEVQKILDGMVTKKVFIEKSWSRDPQKPAATVTDDERGRAYVPLSSVPQKDRATIENLMRSSSRRVTPDKVQRAYAAYLIGDRTLFSKVIGE
jgi:hypothetical protein